MAAMVMVMLMVVMVDGSVYSLTPGNGSRGFENAIYTCPVYVCVCVRKTIWRNFWISLYASGVWPVSMGIERERESPMGAYE